MLKVPVEWDTGLHCIFSLLQENVKHLGSENRLHELRREGEGEWEGKGRGRGSERGSGRGSGRDGKSDILRYVVYAWGE